VTGYSTSPRRVVPRPGQAVTVLDLDARTAATIVAVADDGRTVTVETEDGAQLSFVLRRGTATFTAATDSAWPRLVFDR
jgi:hypothetical protein